VIEELATEGDDTEGGKVYATDAILSHLMACPRSVYGWDIVVQKMGDQVAAWVGLTMAVNVCLYVHE
jgi:translation initiation factor 3 subunit D